MIYKFHSGITRIFNQLPQNNSKNFAKILLKRKEEKLQRKEKEENKQMKGKLFIR